MAKSEHLKKNDRGLDLSFIYNNKKLNNTVRVMVKSLLNKDITINQCSDTHLSECFRCLTN